MVSLPGDRGDLGNLQNVPGRDEWAKIRECFVAAEGCLLIDCDYSQFEIRALADGAGEEGMFEFFRRAERAERALNAYLKEHGDSPTDELKALEQEVQDSDFHTLNAIALFGREFTECEDPKKKKEIRARAKGLSFGIPYGIGAAKLARQYRIPKEQAQKMIDAYYRQWPAVKAYLEEARQSARRRRSISDAYGRRRFAYVPPAFDGLRTEKYRDAGEALWSAIEREFSNYRLQAINGDALKRACVLLDPILREYGARIVLMVHDELVVECPEGKAESLLPIIQEKMIEGARQVGVTRCPLQASGAISKHWVH